MSSDVAEAHANEQERYRKYRRNQHTPNENEDDVDGVVATRSFDTDPSDMSDDEIEKQYWELQKLREKEFYNGDPQDLAIKIAKRQNELYSTAKTRGFTDRLVDESNTEFA